MKRVDTVRVSRWSQWMKETNRKCRRLFFIIFSNGRKEKIQVARRHRRKKLGQLEKSDCCSGQRSLISLASSSQSYRMPPQNIHQNESERKRKKKKKVRAGELRNWGQVGGPVGSWTMTKNWYANKNFGKRSREMSGIEREKERNKKKNGRTKEERQSSLGTGTLGSQSREARAVS